MSSRLKVRILAALLFLWPAFCAASELMPETAGAWDQYIAAVKADMQKRADGAASFLWVSSVENGEERLRQGEILTARTTGSGPEKVPHGMIHDWTGAVFVPGVTLEQVAQVLDNYERYKDFYRPQVAESQVVDRAGDSDKIRLVMVQSAYGVTAAVEIENDVQVFHVAPQRAFTYSYSTHAREIADYGKANQRQHPEDHGPGYVWRVFTITRLEERNGGVYVEEQTIEMSRGIPIALRWMIKPLTEHLARAIMTATMSNTQKAVTQELANAKARAAR